MSARWRLPACLSLGLSLWLAATAPVAGGLMQKRDPGDRAPSWEQVMWTETDVGYDAEAFSSYAAAARVDFGAGKSGRVGQFTSEFSHVFMTRAIMAFLLHQGVEWQRMGFSGAEGAGLPGSLHVVRYFLATDFRWSERDMMRLQVEPGLYGDLQEVTGSDFNVPIAAAYSRIASRRFQWAVGVGWNSWRSVRFLPGGGFRYSPGGPWKFKVMLPRPRVEYRATPAVHLWTGADFRGESFRVSGRFGDRQGDAALNHALLDYQDIRVGVGFSWNILPLIALDGEVGCRLDQSFDYHNNGRRARGERAPYVGIRLRALFRIVPDDRPLSVQLQSMSYRFPSLAPFLGLPD